MSDTQKTKEEVLLQVVLPLMGVKQGQKVFVKVEAEGFKVKIEGSESQIANPANELVNDMETIQPGVYSFVFDENSVDSKFPLTVSESDPWVVSSDKEPTTKTAKAEAPTRAVPAAKSNRGQGCSNTASRTGDF